MARMSMFHSTRYAMSSLEGQACTLSSSCLGIGLPYQQKSSPGFTNSYELSFSIICLRYAYTGTVNSPALMSNVGSVPSWYHSGMLMLVREGDVEYELFHWKLSLAGEEPPSVVLGVP